MNAAVFFVYRALAIPLAWTLFQLLSVVGGEKWRALRRAKNAGLFRTNGTDEAGVRDGRPFWIHAASGEIEYARPVIRALKENFPSVPVLVTYGSVSAVRILEKLPVDAWGPVPWEFGFSVRAFLRRFRPRALLVARTDLWPVLVDEVHRAGIPSMIFAATFAENSSRLRGLTRRLTGKSLRQLDAVQVVSADDRRAVDGLCDPSRVRVAGDTRFDQVLHRLEHPAAVTESLRPAAGPVLVAGSTWPEDEAVLLPALAARGNWKLLLAPHEVGEDRLRELEKTLSRLGLDSQRYGAGGAWTKRVLLLDRVGLLAELYRWGDLAFVGGSFRRQVHSVMEPLAAGRRVLVGPFHANNREALEFRAETIDGRPAVVPVRDAADFGRALDDAGLRAGAEPLRQAVAARRGATAAVLEWARRIPR